MRISDWSSDVCSSDLFLIPLLVRRHGMDLTQAGLIFALSFSFATALGTTTGGFVADWLGRRDVRWSGWAPALLLCLALTLYVAALHRSDWLVLMDTLFAYPGSLSPFFLTFMTVTQPLVNHRVCTHV